MARPRWTQRLAPSDEALLRWAPRAYLVAAVALVPWVAWLGATLPGRAAASHYRLAWVGFDCFLVFAIARTAWLGWRRRPEAELAAVVTASLLIVDAWFDVTTASTGADRLQAVLLAAFAEVPGAIGSIYLVRRVNRIVTHELEVAAGHHGRRPDEEPLLVPAEHDGPPPGGDGDPSPYGGGGHGGT